LVLVFIEAGLLLLILNLDYLAFVFLVVYVGAIAVLFLFVTMMLNIRTLQINISTIAYLPATIFLLFAVLFQLFLVFHTCVHDVFSGITLSERHFLTDMDGCPMPDTSGVVDAKSCLTTVASLDEIQMRSFKRGFLVHFTICGVFTKEELISYAPAIMGLSYGVPPTRSFDYTFGFSRNLISSHRPLYNDFVSYFYSMPSINSFAHCFYTFFYSSIFAAALVLLVAMIGSISLTLYYRAEVRRQASYQQILREHFSSLKNPKVGIKNHNNPDL